jgi:hypothetical protein
MGISPGNKVTTLLTPGKTSQDYFQPGISASKVITLLNKVVTLFLGVDF